jgi:hypothetical protein
LHTALNFSKDKRNDLQLISDCFLTEDISYQLLLPTMEPYNWVLETQNGKRNNFYATNTVLNREQTRAGCKLRYKVIRMVVHNFHYKVCKVKIFHVPNDKCVLSLWK